MRINILKKGDRVIGIMQDSIIVAHKNGEAEIIPFIRDELGLRPDMENTIIIGFGEGTVEKDLGEDVVLTVF